MLKEVCISEKYALTVEESAKYFGIGIGKIRRLASENMEDFVLKNGTKLLIKRKKFETFLDRTLSV